ncbi:pimeloyl-ACP methyl ester carboxylesterase [Chitinophaga niastensis]|uniref:Pimeloyl-ACP methyl ester carboxylesterase n=1 Tax=Chitinophaga niastensis TaxID=536980 RepID=A0A2P8HNZ5_CHINA|nr:alpha/beta hydrolase [Chitinophaga niastensis]PSL47939.1 pimeloyl-ACP methyl ester carboxylesterase [Chitinophaga niastensis]
MPFIQANDQTRLFYTDWKGGNPIVFVHSWAMNSDMWEYHMLHFHDKGMRCIAMDRRGHGRSDRPGHGYHLDQHADDLASLLEALDLHEVTLVAHSMGGAEVARYFERYGTARIARVVFIAAAIPFLLQTADNPEGIEPKMLEATIHAFRTDFPKWLNDGADAFYLPDTLGTSPGITQWTINMMLRTSLKAVVECSRVLTSSDLREGLRKLTIPTLIIHGDTDASVPVKFGRMAAALIPGCIYKEYAGAPHGIFFTHMAELQKDIAEFIAE